MTFFKQIQIVCLEDIHLKHYASSTAYKWAIAFVSLFW